MLFLEVGAEVVDQSVRENEKSDGDRPLEHRTPNHGGGAKSEMCAIEKSTEPLRSCCDSYP